MRLSTSTNILYNRGDLPFIPRIESVRRCAAAGYRVMDIDFCSGIARDDYELKRDNWESWVDELGEAAAKSGVSFSQSHPPFYNMLDPAFPQRDLYEELIRRAIIASGRLGVKWMAMHAGTAVTENRSPSASRSGNAEYFLPLLENASAYGMGIAIENMQEELAESRMRPRRRFTANVEELCGFVDSLAADNAGVTWDFGHGHITGHDPYKSLVTIGKRLKAVHVHDNLGLYDDHTLPFWGTLDWNAAMQGLKDIGYAGDFTYELARYTIRTPESLIGDMLALSYKTGQYLLSLV